MKNTVLLNLIFLFFSSNLCAQIPTVKMIYPNERALMRIKEALPDINKKLEYASFNQLTSEDINRYFSSVLSPDFHEIEYQIIPESIALSKKITNPGISKLSGILPESVDNSILPGFPEIRDQSTWGACGAFSIAYYLFTHEISLLTQWNNKKTDNSRVFSPSWLFNHSGNGMAVTGSNAFSIFSQHGAATWSEFPYDLTSDSIAIRRWPTNPEIWLNALKYKAGEYGELFGYQISQNIDLLKTLLVNGHVGSITCYIDQWEYAHIKDDNLKTVPDSLIGEWVAIRSGGSNPVHSMTVVGYNDNIWVDINENSIVDEGERGAFKVANSYGSTWKNKGYVWVAYDAIHDQSRVKNSAIDNNRKMIFTKCCWILPRKNYIPLLSFGITLSTPDRCEIKISIGKSMVSTTTPDTLFASAYFNYNGDHFSIDGTDTPSENSVYFDLTDLIVPVNICRYYVKIDTRNTTCTISKVVLYNYCLKKEVNSSSQIANIGKNSTLTIFQDYQFPDTNCQYVILSKTGPEQCKKRTSINKKCMFTLLGKRIENYSYDAVNSLFKKSLSSSLYIDGMGRKIVHQNK